MEYHLPREVEPLATVFSWHLPGGWVSLRLPGVLQVSMTVMILNVALFSLCANHLVCRFEPRSTIRPCDLCHLCVCELW